MSETNSRYGRPLEPIRLVFDADHIRRLREMSREQQRSMSSIARMLIEQGLQRLEDTQRPAA